MASFGIVEKDKDLFIAAQTSRKDERNGCDSSSFNALYSFG
jgi:hypothetical protein